MFMSKLLNCLPVPTNQSNYSNTKPPNSQENNIQTAPEANLALLNKVLYLS